MKRLRFRARAVRRVSPWLVLAVACIAPAASAVEGNAPGLARAVDAAWMRAVEGRRAEGESARADAHRRIARSFAAAEPSLALSRLEGAWYGGPRAGTGTETEVGLSVPLWMPGQRGAARAAAGADVEWAEANLAQARLEVAGQVREAAWEIATRQATQEQAQAKVAFLAKLATDVERRVKAGDLARTDELAARADLLAAEAERDDAERGLHDSIARWKVLTGLDALPDADEIENESHADVESLLAKAGTPPSLIAAEKAVLRAEGGLKAVRRSLGSPPELTVGAKDEADAPGVVGDRSLIVELKIPLGFGARRSLARAQAQTELDVAQAELSIARSRYAADLEAARLAIVLADRQLESESRRAGLLAERVRLMQQAFSAGEIDLAELLLTTRYSAEADADRARRHAEHGLAHARLLQAIGMLP